MTELAYIHTSTAITVFLDNIPISFANDAIEYEEAARVLYDPILTNDAKLEAIAALRTRRSDAEIHKWEKVRQLSDNVTIVDDVVHWDGQPLHNSLALRLFKLLSEEKDVTPLVEFLENLMENPSNRVVENLYDFLEFGQIPITSDGHFLAYKAVRDNFYDIHSGTFDNSVGRTCEVPRNRVDENPDNTCSHGLHVCSYSYLPFFSHANGHVVVCKINPADVVAIPRDYNNTKMRVCRYEVVGEVTDYYRQGVNVLSESPFNDAYDDSLDTDPLNSYKDIDWNFSAVEPTGLPTFGDLADEGRFVLFGTDGYLFVEDQLASADTIAEAMQKLQVEMSYGEYPAYEIRDSKNDFFTIVTITKPV